MVQAVISFCARYRLLVIFLVAAAVAYTLFAIREIRFGWLIFGFGWFAAGRSQRQPVARSANGPHRAVIHRMRWAQPRTPDHKLASFRLGWARKLRVVGCAGLRPAILPPPP